LSIDGGRTSFTPIPELTFTLEPFDLARLVLAFEFTVVLLVLYLSSDDANQLSEFSLGLLMGSVLHFQPLRMCRSLA
jgi:hypothetical protein